ncbi:MAG: deoxyribonuclease [Frankiaceae bacterium]|jgi:deoxyribonuclease-4|nr:deoxyribonuclease [Frankiaceae bacterium]
MAVIGAHVRDDDPLRAAKERGADAVQFFLADPQGWKKPEPRADAEELKASDVAIYIHSPYLVNVASLNNKIRVPSRKILSQHAEAAATVGATALIVHGGHVGDGDDIQLGIDNWRKTFEREQFPVQILIENTAGGENACARKLEVIDRLFDAVGEFGVGFCLDTCHAHAAGESLDGIVERVLAVTGRIDLVHCNGSKDPFGSGRDRHENLALGEIDPLALASVVRAAGAPVIVETPADGQAADIEFLRQAVAP